MIKAILNLTDVDIAKMVGRAGHDWVSDWSEQDESIFVGVLIRNRERLRSSRALRVFGINMGLWLGLLDDLVIEFYEKLIIPRKVGSIFKYQGIVKTVLELQGQVILSPKARIDRVNSIYKSLLRNN
jgi:hypothetical protein